MHKIITCLIKLKNTPQTQHSNWLLWCNYHVQLNKRGGRSRPERVRGKTKELKLMIRSVCGGAAIKSDGLIISTAAAQLTAQPGQDNS
jgi:hypothetical protein